MIDSKQAVQFAYQNLYELVGTRELANVEGIQLEELELTDDSKYWNVTVSYPIKKEQQEEALVKVPESLAKFVRDSPKRKWRTLKIDSQDGKLVAMKMPAAQ
jgi:CO dehydrogenase/acetyl-CoA synthase delta subunit